jgi:hypothetical protein
VTRAALHGGTPSVWSPHSYANSSFREECYQCAVVSSKNLGQTRLPPALHHKGEFASEWEEDHALGLKVPGYLYTITTSAFCTHYQ